MPATFTRDLCGYRANGNPNTSDNNDSGSIALGRALFEVLGVPENQSGPADAGAALEDAVKHSLAELRPDLEIERSRPAVDFEQYAHLAVFPTFRRAHVAGASTLERLATLIASVPDDTVRARLTAELSRVRGEMAAQDALVDELKSHMPEEAILAVDITVGEPQPAGLPMLRIALSSKWSLRTDRAQDCVSQGAKLVAQRRGRMPHFAVVTIEPRPAMLKILGDGSGSIDCVYHLDLPALTQAMEQLAEQRGANWSPMRTFRRLVGQRRLRDYDDLLAEARRLPVVDVADP